MSNQASRSLRMKLSVYMVNALGKKGYLKSFINKVKSLPSLVSDDLGL